MTRTPFRKVRDDKKIGNINDLPKEATKGWRSDTHLGTILKENRVTNKEALKQKIRDQNKIQNMDKTK